jgi:hypothetical protein
MMELGSHSGDYEDVTPCSPVKVTFRRNILQGTLKDRWGRRKGIKNRANKKREKERQLNKERKNKEA